MLFPFLFPIPPGYNEYPRRGAMGYSMRTDRYRFTLWQDPDDPHSILATELYNHEGDPKETVNIAHLEENTGLIENLTQQLRAGWKAALPEYGL